MIGIVGIADAPRNPILAGEGESESRHGYRIWVLGLDDLWRLATGKVLGTQLDALLYEDAARRSYGNIVVPLLSRKTAVLKVLPVGELPMLAAQGGQGRSIAVETQLRLRQENL